MNVVFERRGSFRNKLQYFYSIGVFVGVLGTAYLLMDRESGMRLPPESVQSASNYRVEAGVGDDALARLIEVENALTAVRESSRAKDPKRSVDHADFPRKLGISTK
ncbi:MAG: hypothetical protein HYR96_13615 [Deltaproteobacteria bacterium]|nr:hypothetical protein [Deltaproteobacteria bacterium]MBI3293815.1 hypothetical protein [Deltaproteobacteria bacterium]